MDYKSKFIRTFEEAICNGNAAVFAGAGLSAPSGYVSWKDINARKLNNPLYFDRQEDTNGF